MSKVQIKNFEPCKVAYVRFIGPYGPGCGEAWGQLMQWAGPRGLFGPTTQLFGVSLDDPEVTPPEKCRYDACISVPADFKDTGEINLADMPGGEYAVYDFDGPMKDIGQAWQAMFAQYLPDSGYQPDDRPCFEMYGMDSMTGCSHCEDTDVDPNMPMRFDICVPVKLL